MNAPSYQQSAERADLAERLRTVLEGSGMLPSDIEEVIRYALKRWDTRRVPAPSSRPFETQSQP
jgi:hypothetical protein